MADEILVEKETEEFPRRVQFTFTEAPDYKVVFVNGVYGGLTEKGEIICDFFQEAPLFPNKEVFKISQDGKKGDQIEPDPDSPPEQVERIRTKQFGVIMTVGFAKALRGWLDDKLEAYKSIKAEQEASETDE